ncbi:hypothetical protein [Bacillus mycoides]|uniref:hypothetical protein n=1 Tax=Bacillus mycoides TaxID=1405 RepID=UPI00273AD47C|nr:hypothetical protein [Bacillus mycoides]
MSEEEVLERIEYLKNEIKKKYKQQDKLCEKYKSVRKYRGLQQDIGIMNMEIERLEEEW